MIIRVGIRIRRAAVAGSLVILLGSLAVVVATSATNKSTADAAADACGGEVVTDPSPNGLPWLCTFDDEFNGTSLDLTKWAPAYTPTTGFATGPPGSVVCYFPSWRTITESGGDLHLMVNKEAKPFNCGSFTTQFDGGSVSTYQRFSQTYGRFEVRAQLPSATVAGLQETLWLWPNNDKLYGAEPASGEIDFAEFYSNYPNKVIPYVHYVAAKPDPNVTNFNCSIGDPTAFHNYSVVWSPTRLTIEVDGSPCLTDVWNPAAPLSAPAPFNQPFFIALTQALGVNSNSYVDGTTPLPAITSVDYARAWSSQETPQAITFTPSLTGVYGGSQVLSATGGGGTAPVTFSVDPSSDVGVCAISGSTLSYNGLGTCAVDANQAGDDNYVAAPQVQATIAVQVAPQTITFAPNSAGAFGGSQTLSAVGGGGSAPVTFSVDPLSQSGVCALNGSTLAYTGVGTCVVDANQAGDDNFFAATQVQAVVTVSRATLTVTASSPSVLFGATPPTITDQLSGLVNGDTADVVTGLSCSTTATSTSKVGSYPSACLGGSAPPNYALRYVAGRVTVLAPSGAGTLNTTSPAVYVVAPGQTLTFVYTATSDGTRLGQLTMAVPTGWAAPSLTGTAAGFATSTCGGLKTIKSTITVGIELAPGASCQIVYGDRSANGPGLTAPSTAGSATFAAMQRSTANGALTALSASPVVTVQPRPVVTSLSVKTGPAHGGTVVTISGRYFEHGDTVALVGAGVGTAVSANAQGNLLTFTTCAASTPGTYNVIVTSPAGVSSVVVAAARFTYTKAKAAPH